MKIYGFKDAHAKSWILGKIERIIRQSANNVNLPINLFLHQGLFFKYEIATKCLDNSQSIVLFFHYRNKQEVEFLKQSKVISIICQSSQGKKDLITNGVAEDKIFVINTGIDTHLFSFKKNENSTIKIGVVGSAAERKGLHILPTIIDYMSHVEWVIIGNEWKKYCTNLHNVSFLDSSNYDKFPSMYKKFDIFFCPSFVEGGPVPLMEAMFCGHSCVMSNTGMANDLITHGKNGHIYNVGDISNAICLIELLLNNKLLRRETGIKAHETVNEMSWNNYGTNIVEFCKGKINAKA